MIWLTRWLILLLLILQPLRGVAAAELCHCLDGKHAEPSAVLQHHADHDEADETLADAGSSHDHDHGGPDHDHCKNCPSCCSAAGAALANHVHGIAVLPAAVATAGHITPFVPISPTETSLRPPIA